jgi:hypothetical protein
MDKRIQNYLFLQWLKEIIKDYYGNRCKDFDKDCYTCRAYEFFDGLEEVMSDVE